MVSIELTEVSLNYPVLHPVELSVKGTFRQLATGGRILASGRRTVEIAALEDVNLRIKEGERVGVVGHNGAGKTTLLKVIAGIYRAQKGRFRREGRLATVINPGNGLQMEVTGYENIENIGLLAGMTLSQVRAQLDDVVEFTELGDFLALPVSTYSTGMMTRLAFAMATIASPEILVVDENLSTGDAAFVERAQARMAAMMRRSSILVLASHSVDVLDQFTSRAILLEHGRIIADGPVKDVVAEYSESAAAKSKR